MENQSHRSNYPSLAIDQFLEVEATYAFPLFGNRTVPSMTLPKLHGVWSINNPDRGEILGDPAARLITGGTIAIDGHSGTAVANFSLRDNSGASERSRAAGKIRQLHDGAFELRFTDDSFAIFSYVNGRLERLAHSRTTAESALILTKLDDVISDQIMTELHLPGILFNTMPKSGSIFILRCLSRGLAIPETKIAVCLFPDDLIIRSKVDDLALGNTVVQQHIPARDINLRFLRNRLPRMVTHLRDPRQATLSWLHHLDNFHAHRETVPACALGLEATTPALPQDYFSWEQEKRLDYLLATHLPNLITWTQNWVDAADKATGPDILLTRYEDFVADQQVFLRKLLDFFQIPETAFDWSRLPAKTAQTHYRKGSTNEWKLAFTLAQQEKAKSAIPKDLAKRLGWDLE